MNRFKLLSAASFVVLLFATCIYRREMTFKQTAVERDSTFFSAISDIAKKEGYLEKNAKPEGPISFYRITFRERQVENGNVVDYTNLSNDSLAVPYGASYGTFQELYLANIPMSDNQDNLFVYYSLNYNSDSIVISFGPAYLGQLVPCPSDTTIKQIEFFASLKSNRKAPFILHKTLEKTDLKFLLSTHTDSSIIINKIVQAAPNKIGGSRPLVFNVDSILGRDALNFKIVTHE